MPRLILALVVLGFFAWIWALIFKKAGYSSAMCVLMVVPIVNLVTLVYFAFAEWPALRAIRDQRSDAWQRGPTDRVDSMLRQAADLERSGQWQDAAKAFEILAEELKGQPGSMYAAHSAQRIRERHTTD